ncbi:MAG: hypothetical protein ABSD13_09440 [Candidatus Korobacteraceae bacterium]|jgi:hypothetical protein
MNRLLTLILIGLAGLLASCGSTVSSSSQPTDANYTYSMVVSPTLFTVNSGDWAPLSATVEVSFENQTPKPLAPQPTTKFYSSDSRVTISPAGEVCAGLWDNIYETCAQTSTLPTGYVTITAYDATRNVSATALLSVHPRAATIALSADSSSSNSAFWPGSVEPWPSTVTGPSNCVSQNNQVQYVAQPIDAGGNPISSCSLSVTAGCVNNNDYTWSVADSNVAEVSTYGYVVARNPGVTSVYAKLNGTISAPAAFATCPPSSIVLASSAFAGGLPLAPYSAADLDTLSKGTQEYFTASLLDANGNPLPPLNLNGASLAAVPLNFITSNPLTGSFGSVLPLTAKLTANTSGRLTVMVSCDPATCNNAVPNFTLPLNPSTCSALTAPESCVVTGEAAGFGYPVYSNVIGVSVLGTSGSTVLVTGTTLADGVTLAHRLEAYDSESLANTRTVELANLPNSLVVAPNGATAYVGSSAGLVVVNLSTFTPALQTYPIVGGLNTDVVTGQVLGVSPDSRFVLLSDQANSYVFLIDTTGTKVATRYTIPGVNSVTFAADDSHFWIGGSSGVYVYTADTFIPIGATTPTDAGLSTNVKALAWTPDGQSYFASGDQLVNYSTCYSQNPQSPSTNLPTSVVGGLSATFLSGVPYVLGLDGSQWFDYPVTSTSQVVDSQTESGALNTLKSVGTGFVCKSTVTVNPPNTAAVSLPCAATQITFSPILQQEFITGVDPNCTTTDSVIHGYDLASHAVISTPQSALGLTTTNPVIPLSGGVLNDGRKLYFGTSDIAAGTAALHRIDLSTGTGSPGTLTEDASVTVTLVPSFVAVVPK